MPASWTAFVLESAIVGRAASLKLVVCANEPVDTRVTSLQLVAPDAAPVLVTEPPLQV